MLRSIAIFLMLSAVSCGEIRDMKPEYERFNLPKKSSEDENTNGQCRAKAGLACMSGSVIRAPRITLANDEFFDAEEMGRHIVGNIKIKGSGSQSTGSQGFKVFLNPEITNDNFTRGFKLYVKGERAFEVRIERDGTFSLDNLYPGDYELIVQKKIAVEVTQESPEAIPSDEFKEQHPSSRELCLTLFAEVTNFFLEKGDRKYIGFDHYEMEVFDFKCSDERDAVIEL